MSDNNRKAYEKKFHDDYVTNSKEIRKNQSHFYSREIEKKEYEYVFKSFGDLNNKKLLFFGSGGHFSLLRTFVEKGAFVVAIDISFETIKKMSTQIKRCGLESKCVAIQMDCENMGFAGNGFDVVFGRSIIHHLDIKKTLGEIRQAMTPGGKVAFIEPLGENPLINLYRRLTPEDRTPFEHPLTKEDILCIYDIFPESSFKYLYALSLFSFFYRILTKDEKKFLKLFHHLHKMDDFLLKILPVYWRLCWDVICICKKEGKSL